MLERIVFLWGDISTVGGISNRIRATVAAANGRSFEYWGISAIHSKRLDQRRIVAHSGAAAEVEKLLQEWSPRDTVFIVANNGLRTFPRHIQDRVQSFPIIYMCSGQMAFMIQDSNALGDLEYVRRFRASAIISFTDADIGFQRQLGIFGQTKGFIPVQARDENTYRPDKNIKLGYVGRIDFHTKDCERLIDVARAAKTRGLPPIKVFTTAHQNSPHFNAFLSMVAENELKEQFEITLECIDKNVLYDRISCLLLPSKKEAFGNVVLEAFSYGIPVFAASYAPGPAEIITHGKTGFLFDDFDGEKVIDLYCGLSNEQLQMMSQAAFKEHKKYSMDAHLDFLEALSSRTISTFSGENRLPVFPVLRVARQLEEIKKKRAAPSRTASKAPQRAKLLKKIRSIFRRLLTCSPLFGPF